ncbi:MAG: radical SAM protein [Candidatus Undinarchaeales archaeon]
MTVKRIVYEDIINSKKNSEYFLIDIGEKKIFYCPRKGIIGEITKSETLETLKNKAKKYPVAKRLKKPKTTNEIGLLLTQNCNMRCIYCYVSGGKNKKSMDWNTAKKAIDYKLKTLPKKSNTLVIYFYGGEPTLEFELMKKSVEYAKKTSKKNLEIATRIFTNGTFSDEVAKWFKENNTKVIITAHLLKKFQNKYRPLASGKKSYKMIEKNIRLLNKFGVDYMISFPMTKKESDKIEEIIENAKKLGIKKLGMSVVLEKGRCLKTNIKAPKRSELIKSYKKAKTLGKKKEITVKIPRKTLKDIFTLKCIYCGVPAGDLMVLPNKDITTCYGMTDADRKCYDKFICGKVTTKGVEMNKNKLKKIRSITIHKSKKCEKCFAKWNCGGSCYVENQEKNKSYTDPPEKFCKLQREEIKKGIKKILESKNSELPILVETIN